MGSYRDPIPQQEVDLEEHADLCRLRARAHVIIIYSTFI